MANNTITPPDYIADAKTQLSNLVKIKAATYRRTSNNSIDALIKRLENKKKFLTETTKVLEKKVNDLYEGYVVLFGEDQSVAQDLAKTAASYLSKTVASL